MTGLKHGVELKLTKESRFDLAEIMAAIGEASLSTLSWKVQMEFFVIHYQSEFAQSAERVDVLGEGWLHCRSARRGWSYEQLMRLSIEKHQVVDGEFIGFKTTPKGKKKWVVLKAVDSSWWEVWSPDQKLLDRVRDAFPGATELGNA